MLDTWNVRVGKYEEKIKFDKIWGYQNTGIFCKQGRQDSKFNHLRWTEEVFRIGNNEEEIKFDKIWGYQNEGIPHTRTPKFKIEPLTLVMKFSE